MDIALTNSNDVEIHMPDVNLKLCCMGFFFEKFKASFKIYQLNFCNYEELNLFKLPKEIVLYFQFSNHITCDLLVNIKFEIHLQSS